MHLIELLLRQARDSEFESLLLEYRTDAEQLLHIGHIKLSDLRSASADRW